MKLADLAYEVARDSIEFPSGFNKDGFIGGEYDNDRDFSSQISFAFNYINLAFSRLVTARKTLLAVEKTTSDADGLISFNKGDVTAVATSDGPDYERVRFRQLGNGKVEVGRPYSSRVLYVEYRPYMPRFALADVRKQSLDGDGVPYYAEVDVDLAQYGISDEMCSYVKEYAKGGLLEYLSPDLSQKHVQMAENYFASLKTQHTEYPQRKVDDLFCGGGVL